MVGQREWMAAFVTRLGELGWVEGRTVAIEYRWAEGHFDRAPALIGELLRLKIDIIVTHGTPECRPPSRRLRIFRSCSR